MTILAGLVSEGTSNLKYHALRPGTAACSSYLMVQREGEAHLIQQDHRCRAKGCAKLFREADLAAKAKLDN
jgi:hypothetical protein